jgi:hypothetical protein
VHVIWTDQRDGHKAIYYKRNLTGNSGVSQSPLGGLNPLSSKASLSVVPNPFSSFATLPGHDKETFTLYDVSGRKVGTYRGDRIAAGLSAGVYFLMPESWDAKPVRIVKLR